MSYDSLLKQLPLSCYRAAASEMQEPLTWTVPRTQHHLQPHYSEDEVPLGTMQIWKMPVMLLEILRLRMEDLGQSIGQAGLRRALAAA